MMANMLSQSVACAFHLLTVSFKEKFPIFLKSNLSYFSLLDCAFGVLSKNLRLT